MKTTILEWLGKLALGLHNSSRRNTLILSTLLVALLLPLVPQTSAADSTLNHVRTTHYTLVTEWTTSGQHTGDWTTVTNPARISGTYSREFLYSGWGVAMQGTGLASNGKYIQYQSGGSGWGPNYRWLNEPSTATFREVDGVFGSSGRRLIEDFSIAVDRNVIPLGSYVWIDTQGHWYRADDTGGAIQGNHIDIYMGATGMTPAASGSRVYVTATYHNKHDPSPYNTPPAAPTLLSPARGLSVYGCTTLDWSEVNGADTYYYSASQNGQYIASGYSSSSAATACFYNSGQVTWSVSAHNAAGWGGAGWSYFFVGQNGGAISTPGELWPNNWASVSGPSVTLSWAGSNGATSYQVDIQYWNGNSWTPYHTYAPTSNSQTFWPQTHYAYYLFKVRALGGSGTSEWSSWAPFYFNG